MDKSFGRRENIWDQSHLGLYRVRIFLLLVYLENSSICFHRRYRNHDFKAYKDHLNKSDDCLESL